MSISYQAMSIFYHLVDDGPRPQLMPDERQYDRAKNTEDNPRQVHWLVADNAYDNR
jgi:hypothetical protein